MICKFRDPGMIYKPECTGDIDFWRRLVEGRILAELQDVTPRSELGKLTMLGWVEPVGSSHDCFCSSLTRDTRPGGQSPCSTCDIGRVIGRRHSRASK